MRHAMDAGDLSKDSVIVVFSRIPEGVTVMVPGRVGLAEDDLLPMLMKQ